MEKKRIDGSVTQLEENVLRLLLRKDREFEPSHHFRASTYEAFQIKIKKNFILFL